MSAQRQHAGFAGHDAASNGLVRGHCSRTNRRNGRGGLIARPVYRSIDLAVEDVGDLADFGGQYGVFGGEDGLNAVREGFFGLVMDFDEEPISADGDRGTGKRKDFVMLAGAVAGVD